MRKTITAWSACAAAVLPALAATSASADVPVTPAGALQLAGQAASNQQSATSTATSTQIHPANTAIHVAILSPGASSGPVDQANTSNATSAAGNTNGTTQTATQAGGGGASQSAGQQAASQQTASSTATSTQDHPTNTAIHVAILSPGARSGAVHQQNASNASSQAGNTNATRQDATQAGGGGGVQAVGQAAENAQRADSTATSTQVHPSNTAIDVSILSPSEQRSAGDGYVTDSAAATPVVAAAPAAASVDQANTSNAISAAGSTNGTAQSATQAGGPVTPAVLARRTCETCGGAEGSGFPGIQAAGQLASNDQAATSDATSTQVSPLNLAFGSGPVHQANSSNATSAAGSTNGTTQSATQLGGAPGTLQALGQAALNAQAAASHATSTQVCPANLAFAAGGAGSVSQQNASNAGSAAGNTNGTVQRAWQRFAFPEPVTLV